MDKKDLSCLNTFEQQEGEKISKIKTDSDFRPRRSKFYNKYDEEGEIASLATECPFCYIYKTQKERIIYQDEKVFVIQDRTPGARIHYLVNPLRHIKNVNHLKSSDSELISHMESVGKLLIEKENLDKKSRRKLGFHKASNTSIPHLHMHILAGKYSSLLCYIKYNWPFFTTPKEVISKL
ncbi:unnamed protein product [Moneuplotes crassus]|uniref:HIT domain-containing protein n=1 Tax=Euplotes crassus TaxID=5936 RepID=A0AAD2D5E0_EUPCR|nr:unnamed protein product [Moneuplotes crassus]